MITSLNKISLILSKLAAIDYERDLFLKVREKKELKALLSSKGGRKAWETRKEKLKCL